MPFDSNCQELLNKLSNGENGCNNGRVALCTGTPDKSVRLPDLTVFPISEIQLNNPENRCVPQNFDLIYFSFWSCRSPSDWFTSCTKSEIVWFRWNQTMKSDMSDFVEIRRWNQTCLISRSNFRNRTKSDSVPFSVLYHFEDIPYRGPTASTREFSGTGLLLASFPSSRNNTTKTAKQSQQQILRHQSWDFFFCQKSVEEEEYCDWRGWR